MEEAPFQLQWSREKRNPTGINERLTFFQKLVIFCEGAGIEFILFFSSGLSLRLVINIIEGKEEKP